MSLSELSSTPSTGQATGQAVIVVSGLPRSGTSMLMHMLSAGGVPLVVDELRAPDADNPKGYYEFTPVKSLNRPGDKAWVADARGKAIKVISFLLPHLPAEHGYKIIFIKRRLSEVLVSQKRMLERRGEAWDDISDEAMAGMFAAHLAKMEDYLAARENCDVLYIDHREALETPAQVAADINEFLGGWLDTAAMAAGVDGRLLRNRR